VVFGIGRVTVRGDDIVARVATVKMKWSLVVRGDVSLRGRIVELVPGPRQGAGHIKLKLGRFHHRAYQARARLGVCV
jgi:hypothetical protein